MVLCTVIVKTLASLVHKQQAFGINLFHVSCEQYLLSLRLTQYLWGKVFAAVNKILKYGIVVLILSDGYSLLS